MSQPEMTELLLAAIGTSEGGNNLSSSVTRQLFDALATAIYTTDSGGRITGCNRAAIELWGGEPPATEDGRGSWRLLRLDGTELPHDEYPLALSLRQRRPLGGQEAVLQRADGARVPILSYPAPLIDGSGALVGAIDMMVDISAQKRMEEALRQRTAEQSALHALANKLLEAKTLAEVYSAALDSITKALGCGRAAILLLDEAGSMRFVAWTNLSEAYRQAADGHSPWQLGATYPEPVLIEDAAASDLPPNLKALIASERIGALAFIPLASGGKLVGKFMTYFDQAHRFAESEIELAVTIGRQLGISIERIRAEDARTRAENELRESEARFRSLVSLSTDWYWEQDENFRFTSFSDSVLGLAGSSVASHIGKTRWDLPVINASDLQWAEHRATLERHEPFRDFEYQRLNEHGEVVWITTSGDPVFDANGKFKGYRGSGQNITSRRKAEAILRTSEARYKTAIKVGRMGSWETNFVEGTRTWSPEAIELFGLSLPVGKGFVGAAGDELRAAMHPDDRHLLDRFHAEIMTRDEITAEYRIVLPGGDIRYVAGRGQVTARCQDGSPWLLVNIVADVTERSLAEQRSAQKARELEQAKAKYQALVQASAQIEWSAAPDGRIVSDSPTWRAFTGQTFDEWKGWGWIDALHPADRERAAAAWEHATKTRGAYDIDYRVKHLSGEYRWTRARGVPLLSSDEEVLEWVGVNEDINALKQREEHLKVVMRELSHRTKNLLSVIQSIARRTLTAATDKAEVRAFTERLQGLALSHDLLVRGDWHGASLRDLISGHLAPFGPINPDCVTMNGPDVSLTPSAAQSVGLAIHELATNAAKYGALRTEGGRLEIAWTEESTDRVPGFRLTWRERPNRPIRNVHGSGFGRLLLERIAASSVGGSSEYRLSEHEISWTLVAPLAGKSPFVDLNGGSVAASLVEPSAPLALPPGADDA